MAQKPECCYSIVSTIAYVPADPVISQSVRRISPNKLKK
jgi:hypothetical protein